MLSLIQFDLLLQLLVIHLKLNHALRFNFPLPSDIAPMKQLLLLFLINSQIISLTTFLRTALFTPPLLFVRRDEPNLITIF